MRISLHKLDPIWAIPLLLTLVWLGVGWWGRPIGDYGVETDFYGDFAIYARQWMSGTATAMNGFRGPFYYLLLGSLDAIFRDAFAVAKVLSALSAGLSLVLVGKVLTPLWGRLVGVVGILFVAANATFVMHTFRACTDMVYFALFMASLYLLLAAESRDRNWILAGAVAALAVLTRYNGFALLPCALVVALLTVRPMALAIRRLAVFALAWAVFTAPWFAFLWIEKGSPLWSNAYQNVAMDVYSSDPGLAVNGNFVSAIGFHSMVEVFRVLPSRFLGAMAENAMVHFWRDMRDLVGIAWSVAALLGGTLAVIAWRRARSGSRSEEKTQPVVGTLPRQLAYLLCGLVVYLSLVPVFYNPRFMIPLLPFWAVGVGILVTVFVRPFELRRTQVRSAIALVVILLLGLTGRIQLREISNALDPAEALSSPVSLLKIADAARQSGYHFGPDTPIAARKPHIGYYLGAPVVPVTAGLIRERPTGSRARYLLVSGMEVGLMPALRPLMMGQGNPSSMELVARYVRLAGQGQVQGGCLYRFREPIEPEPEPESAQTDSAETDVPDVMDGLDRLDQLRLSIAQWALQFDPYQPVAPLLREIGDQQHPTVQAVWGDLAFYGADLSRAKSFYLRSLPPRVAPGDPTPAGVNNYLRLTAVHALEPDVNAFQSALATYFGLKGIAIPISDQTFWGLIEELRRSPDRVAMLGMAAASVMGQSEADSRLLLYGKLLMATGWPEKGRTVLEACLAVRPHDQEILELLRRPMQQRVEERF